MKDKRQTKRNDLIVIASILTVSLVALLVMNTHWFSSGQASADEIGPYAVIENTEGEYEVLPLAQDATVVVESSAGENTVTIADGAVSVSDADCKNQICVKTGAISEVGQSIICLPHQLVVQVVAEKADASSLG